MFLDGTKRGSSFLVRSSTSGVGWLPKILSYHVVGAWTFLYFPQPCNKMTGKHACRLACMRLIRIRNGNTKRACCYSTAPNRDYCFLRSNEGKIACPKFWPKSNIKENSKQICHLILLTRNF